MHSFSEARALAAAEALDLDAKVAPATLIAGGERRLQTSKVVKRHTISLPAFPYLEGASRFGHEINGRVNTQLNGFKSLDIQLSRTSSSDDLDIPSDTTPFSSDPRSLSTDPECDWATFISAYAHGQWDPHKSPVFPRACHVFQPPPMGPVLKTEQTLHHSLSLQPRSSAADSQQAETNPEQAEISLQSSHDKAGSVIASTANRKFHNLQLDLSSRLSTHRFRHKLPPSTPNGANSANVSPLVSNSELQTTVATMRWAAARVDISPLALPSPEHELTDPMRGLITTVPGSCPSDFTDATDQATTPGGSRRARLSAFWEGTIDVDSKNVKTQPLTGKSRLNDNNGIGKANELPAVPAIGQSISEAPRSLASEPNNQLSMVAAAPPPPPPASAPVAENRVPGDSDYFSNHRTTDVKSPVSAPILDQPLSTEVQSTTSKLGGPSDRGSLTVPALPRRVCLTRQTSSPLPVSPAPHDTRLPAGRVISENVSLTKGGRAAKEEQMFAELGYLAPPNPPDELERRRALYKFNIWNTGPDLNFDRIAHLAKLVFNTRGVLVSLVDGNEQWFKSEWGLKSPSTPRTHSLCGHTILQQGDEPMIVLDTHLDWRFSKNPLVTGPPYIRFYAGAPLRTQDGYNIGTLALIDDVPRDDCSPRQRHTLKEFAAIAMREMELWRDKIQLRIRDRIQSSMEEFTRECLEIDSEPSDDNHDKERIGGTTSMDRVYDRAAKLVQRTLDVEGVIVMDVAHCEVLETMGSEGIVSVTLHHGEPGSEMEKRQLSAEDYHSLRDFFAKHADGKISEGILPHCFRPYMPTHIQYALLVPIFNIDKRPFALLCAYNTNSHSKRLLEGHELSYLRAIGVIILSAVLKRRMILADKAKSLFISNISHELRTPLHGILAAAELLSESSLNHSQMSFIQTVQACGTSLVETVNHVLDFTKLSGNGKAGGVDNVFVPTATDLMQLIEEAVDGSWIGYRARTAILGDSGIGSVYSPPSDDTPSSAPLVAQPTPPHVETVIDIGYNEEGWLLKFEKGGIRRVLMNLFGNSLKFTSDGYVHVRLRLLPRSLDDPPNSVKVELAIEDTGKGISQNFLKNQLFHPFSQENPLQTGTGLGLAIVNSIVSSENVGGKVDVWSEEGCGTEIKVVFPAEKADDDLRLAEAAHEMQPFETSNMPPTKISLVGFVSAHKGIALLRKVLCTHISTWWGLEIVEGDGDIVILNETVDPILSAIEKRDNSRPFVILWAARGNPRVLSIIDSYERIGGFCRILYKPSGPSKLRAILKLCIHAIKIDRYRDLSPVPIVQKQTAAYSESKDGPSGFVFRRNSDEHGNYTHRPTSRPQLLPRSMTIHPSSSLRNQLLLAASPSDGKAEDEDDNDRVTVPLWGGSIIPVGTGSESVIKSSTAEVPEIPDGRLRVLVIEDNHILRGLLTKWLVKKGYEYVEAVDGQEGVRAFAERGPFDVALIDLSMPVLDGIAATTQIRQMEASEKARPIKILALTGMSSLEDKHKAFEAGVDGYLVKPVAFKTLDETFKKLRLSPP